MPRGGSRPGAGATRGNLNALKHGGRSACARALILSLLHIPAYRLLLLRLASHTPNRSPSPAPARFARALVASYFANNQTSAAKSNLVNNKKPIQSKGKEKLNGNQPRRSI